MMLKRTLTVGATALLAILASAGVASAAEVDASQSLPLHPITSPAEPESNTLPDEDDAESTDTEPTSEPESDTPDDSTTDESNGSSDESDSTSESDSDATTEPEDELEPVEPAPAPIEEPAPSGPLGLIQSLVTSLFG